MIRTFLLENYTIITHLVEIIAAIFGSFYLYKNRDQATRFFVYYLWLIVIVENLGLYAKFMHDNYDNELFILIKNSPFCSNYWLYNFYDLLALVLLSRYFRAIISNVKFNKYIKLFAVSYVIFAIIYYLLTGTFFKGGIDYNFMYQTILITIFVFLYFVDLMRSNKILGFRNSKHFYIITILWLWFLAITPLFIFQDYFSLINPEFISFRKLLLLSSNILMYLCFAIIFLLPSLKTK